MMMSASLRLSFGLLALSILCGPSAGHAAQGCLTNAEARKIWPRQHLYWHTGARCWDASSPAERKARSPQRPPAGFALSYPPIPWMETLGWMWGQSFDTKWHEELSDVNQLTPPEVRQFGLFSAFPPRN
jgi:hypothetical protein